MNKALLFGNVGKSPEIRHAPGGTCVATLSLATNFRKSDGEQETTWHRLVAFGNLAELISNHVTKGAKILVEGRIQSRSYEAKDGTGKRYITEIVVQRLEFGDQGSNKDRQSESTVGTKTNETKSSASQFDVVNETDFGDVPF